MCDRQIAFRPASRNSIRPNVVYTCGAMIHGNYLYIPYAIADKTTSMAYVPLKPLLERLVN